MPHDLPRPYEIVRATRRLVGNGRSLDAGNRDGLVEPGTLGVVIDRRPQYFWPERREVEVHWEGGPQTVHWEGDGIEATGERIDRVLDRTVDVRHFAAGDQVVLVREGHQAHWPQPIGTRATLLRVSSPYVTVQFEDGTVRKYQHSGGVAHGSTCPAWCHADDLPPSFARGDVHAKA
jgi:hypothetical protein